MQKICILVITICILLTPVFKNERENTPNPKININNNYNKENDYNYQLWAETISIYLQDELWIEQNAYDSGHYLMVPLHAAFLMNEPEWQKEFSNQVHLFMETYSRNPDSLVEDRLNQLHYLYFLSRFIVLAEQQEKPELVPDGLYIFLLNRVNDVWLNETAWQWGRKPFVGGMQERILWKLENKNVAQSYYRAIIDEELFTIAIAADLRTYEKLAIDREKRSPVVDDVLEKSLMIFKQEGSFQDNGGWLFQPGVWTDSPSYAYAGNLEIKSGMKPIPVEGIAWDSSHSHRFPLYLTSLITAYQSTDEEYVFYKKIRSSLELQFCETVLKEPTRDFPAYRTTNFMDGRNGVYRWNYSSLGEGKGYGPYELSGTFTIGWWTFLGTDRVKKIYRDLAEMYPFSQKVTSLYDGPETGQKRHPIANCSLARIF